jgi:hypothetical protein
MVIVGLYALVPATAAAAEPTMIAVFVDGEGAGPVRDATIRALPQGIQVAESKQFRVELAAAGQKKPFGNIDAKAIDRLRRAAVAVGAEAVVVARVQQEKKRRFVRLFVIDVVAEVPPSRAARLGPKPSIKDSEVIASALGNALDAYVSRPDEPVAPAAEPDSPPVAPPPDPGPAVSEKPPIADVVLPPKEVPRSTPAQLLATSVLDIALGPEAAGRHYEYDNGIARTPYVYRLAASPAARVSGTLFPFATTRGVLADLGIAFDYARIFLGKNEFDGAPNGGAPTAYSLSLRARIHPGLAAGKPRVILGIAVGYAFSSFGLVGPANAELPDIAYRAVRPALDARIPLGSFSLLGGVAFRAIINGDSISPRLDSASGFGLDADLGFAFMFARHFEARALARYERHAFDATAPSGTIVRSGSTVDQSYSARLALGLVF